ncbi:MAG: cupin domain-containing protein [Bryobacterales bacterium]|nr:cupin domain-containing protein [Bryobacterales bacterium]
MTNFGQAEAKSRLEAIVRRTGDYELGFPPGVRVRVYASGRTGARGLTTAAAVFDPGMALDFHRHDCGEAITVLEGTPTVLVEGRPHTLGRLDCVYVPGGVLHAVQNDSATEARIHSAFASPNPQRTFAEMGELPDSGSRGVGCPVPEAVSRFGLSSGYELAPGTDFHDLFAARLGSSGICGGFGMFQPGSGLPCHFHEYDESITIVAGHAVCQVEGRHYEVGLMDTAVIPEGLAHRFVNRRDSPMGMIWVYAGDEPRRVLVDNTRCSGAIGIASE